MAVSISGIVQETLVNNLKLLPLDRELHQPCVYCIIHFPGLRVQLYIELQYDCTVNEVLHTRSTFEWPMVRTTKSFVVLYHAGNPGYKYSMEGPLSGGFWLLFAGGAFPQHLGVCSLLLPGTIVLLLL